MWRTRFVLQGIPAAPQYFIATLTFSIKLQLLRFGYCTNDFNYMLINCAAQFKKNSYLMLMTVLEDEPVPVVHQCLYFFF